MGIQHTNLHEKFQLSILNKSRENHIFPNSLITDIWNYRVATNKCIHNTHRPDIYLNTSKDISYYVQNEMEFLLSSLLYLIYSFRDRQMKFSPIKEVKLHKFSIQLKQYHQDLFNNCCARYIDSWIFKFSKLSSLNFFLLHSSIFKFPEPGVRFQNCHQISSYHP